MYMFMLVIDYNACLSSPCQHGGQCEQNGDGGFECTCDGNYEGMTCSGRYCSTPISVCLNFQRNMLASGYARELASVCKIIDCQ